MKFILKGPVNNGPALVQILVWRRQGDKLLSEPMMVSLLTHVCVTRPIEVKANALKYHKSNFSVYCRSVNVTKMIK